MHLVRDVEAHRDFGFGVDLRERKGVLVWGFAGEEGNGESVTLEVSFGFSKGLVDGVGLLNRFLLRVRGFLVGGGICA